MYNYVTVFSSIDDQYQESSMLSSVSLFLLELC